MESTASNKKRKVLPTTDKLRSETKETVMKLSETLDILEESTPSDAKPLFMDVSVRLLQLKALQRALLENIHQSQTTLLQQKKEKDKQTLHLQSLKYQKSLNEHIIQNSLKPDTTNLLRLCRSEVSEDSPIVGEEKEDEEALLQSFLGADIKDPKQRTVIMEKLQKQFRTRKSLHAQLKGLQKEASTIKQTLNEKQKLLKSLPAKLKDMETASLPVQKFCQKHLNVSKTSGSERRNLLDLSQSLPKPLYTLYYLLQSALDNMETSTEMKEYRELSLVPTLEINADSTNVLLKIPIPKISDREGSSNSTPGFRAGKHLAIITFAYASEEHVVTAWVTPENDMQDLLVEVFPGDTANGNDNDDNYGRPYSWCNYLAGIHLPCPQRVSESDLHLSATLIIRVLLRRVRAQATLSWILNSLSRKPFPLPVHSSFISANFCQQNDSQVRLVAWTEEKSPGDEPFMKSFLATLKRRSSTLSLRVTIQVGQYPSVPPTWELNPQESDGKMELENGNYPLYDEDSADLEHRVNTNIEYLVDSTDESTYEWILSHQLSEIAVQWEAQLAEKGDR